MTGIEDRRRLRLGALAALLVGVGVTGATADPGDGAGPAGEGTGLVARATIAQVLDDWHRAASVADATRYFGHFAPGGVFLGTDDSERWTVDEFRSYAAPYFSRGQGWTYLPSGRHIALSPDRTIAWIDEKLDNDSYGRLRGTGVLRRIDGRWRIEHYSMSFPLPNERTREVVELLRGPPPSR